MKRILLVLTIIISQVSWALPIDWSGTFSTDFSRIVNYNYVDGSSSQTGTSSQVIDTNGNDNLAAFQNYVLRLNPTIIVNDSVSIFGQITTGNIQGGFYGTDTALTNGTNDSNAGMITATRNAGNNNLNLNMIYTELYTDTALYRIGRYTKHWGMGAIFNNGKRSFDRFQSLFDGAEAELNFGKLIMTPYWAKFGTDTLTRDTDYSETGISLLYDNPDKNMQAGVHYSSRTASTNQNIINDSSGTTNLAGATMTIIDLYFKKSWGAFTMEAEIPMLSGDAGEIYSGSGEDQSYQSTSILLDLKYESSKYWTFGLLLGSIKGDDATSNEFGATYIHPNFQIAELMFRYNRQAISTSGAANQLYDSSITNARFARLYSSYYSNNWTINFALIVAKADVVATAGEAVWDHQDQVYDASAGADQSDDLGMEFDFSFDYRWNTTTTFSTFIGFHNVGDYYAYNDEGAEIETANAYTLGARLAIDF